MVKEITVHGGFIFKILMNDIAIITVKKPFKFSKLIGRGRLPKKNTSIEFDPTYDGKYMEQKTYVNCCAKLEN